MGYGHAEDMQTMLVHVIGTHEMLPKSLHALIPVGRCYMGDRHFEMTQECHHQEWRNINGDLCAGLAGALKRFPEKYPDHRYKAFGLTRLDTCRLALAAQFVAASSVRRLSSVDLAHEMESDSWPGPRAPFIQ